MLPSESAKPLRIGIVNEGEVKDKNTSTFQYSWTCGETKGTNNNIRIPKVRSLIFSSALGKAYSL
jgi:hypothetical protein